MREGGGGDNPCTNSHGVARIWQTPAASGPPTHLGERVEHHAGHLGGSEPEGTNEVRAADGADEEGVAREHLGGSVAVPAVQDAAAAASR